MTDARQRAAVATLLAVQLFIAAISVAAVPEIGIFCTAPQDPVLENFGWVHALYVALLLVGLASLIWKPARLPYVIAFLLSSAALPLQYWWVQEGRLYCDAP
ncbi:hypothetical protein L7H23_08260 [Sphingopyxis sp. BSN-002]|uniref:hypothetical protein n=1 Tax=Sphingopyxis sp. BSN-002 TaxID=2911495 RepID=UPI001EDA0871|nr:hypothetical protein [Sphingopyxis sp. BSN-002]UKK86082.1 hypothetical protein L7H23_08260 [Sphingopyxis sp. BSN-002]